MYLINLRIMEDIKQLRLFIPYTTASGRQLATCFDHSCGHLQAVCARKCASYSLICYAETDFTMFYMNVI